jgi:hypothetical protein
MNRVVKKDFLFECKYRLDQKKLINQKISLSCLNKNNEWKMNNSILFDIERNYI